MPDFVTVARVDGGFYATDAACIHLKGRLGEAWLEVRVLACPWHGSRYDLRIGENEFGRAIQLRTYEIRVEDGEVQVAVEPR